MEEARRETRVPVALRVRFRSDSIVDFVERYSVDVSRNGIFIRTQKPLSPGTPLRFEFKLRDDRPLFRGAGTVKWIRTADAAQPGQAPGMGVEFVDLPDESRKVLEEILKAREKPTKTEATGRGETSSPNLKVTPAAAETSPTPARGVPKVEVADLGSGAAPQEQMQTAWVPATSSEKVTRSETPRARISQSMKSEGSAKVEVNMDAMRPVSIPRIDPALGAAPEAKRRHSIAPLVWIGLAAIVVVAWVLLRRSESSPPDAAPRGVPSIGALPSVNQPVPPEATTAIVPSRDGAAAVEPAKPESQKAPAPPAIAPAPVAEKPIAKPPTAVPPRVRKPAVKQPIAPVAEPAPVSPPQEPNGGTTPGESPPTAKKVKKKASAEPAPADPPAAPPAEEPARPSWVPDPE